MWNGRRRLGAAVLALVCMEASAQGQLVTESNLADAILERQNFLPIELNALDLNRDGLVDIADLTYYAILNSSLVPSASFQSLTSKAFEGNGVVEIEIVLTKPVETEETVTYSIGGTATYGTKANGGDFTVAGYNPATNSGSVTIPAGGDSAVIVVTVYDDGLFNEGVETVSFMLTGGGVDSYFLGARQLHSFYIDDNDAVWTVGLVMPDGDGYESFEMEIVQEDGVFDGRVLSDTKLIPTPEPSDADARGDDGWDARFSAGTGTLRIEIGPLPFDRSLSLFEVERTLSYIFEIGPSFGEYIYQPNREFTGIVTTVLEPVKSRLGETDQRHLYLRRESVGELTMRRLPSNVVPEEVVLNNAP